MFMVLQRDNHNVFFLWYWSEDTFMWLGISILITSYIYDTLVVLLYIGLFLSNLCKIVHLKSQYSETSLVCHRDFVVCYVHVFMMIYALLTFHIWIIFIAIYQFNKCYKYYTQATRIYQLQIKVAPCSFD